MALQAISRPDYAIFALFTLDLSVRIPLPVFEFLIIEKPAHRIPTSYHRMVLFRLVRYYDMVKESGLK